VRARVRILLVSDLHYTLPQLDWVLAHASEYDLVVLAGDHLDIGSHVEPDAQIAVALEYLERIAARTTVVAASGNHDLDARDEQGERVASWLDRARACGALVDGMHLDRPDVLVTVCPWWDGPEVRAALERQLVADAELVRDRMWIWVHHAPPDGSPTSWTGKRHYGDEALVAWIERYRPAAVLCGHVHNSPWMGDGGWSDRIGDTLVLNAGRQPGSVPSRIEIDTDADTVEWWSFEGVVERPLRAA
jgi:Icc-related predicted phosphoesterase